MSGFIVDASVAIKWFIDEPQSELTLPLLDRPLAAPDLLCPECANILWKKATRGELTTTEVTTAGEALRAADIALHPTRALLGEALRLAQTLGHPAYDCFYLALAQQLAWPLVTADQRLVRATRNGSPEGLVDLVVPLTALDDAL